MPYPLLLPLSLYDARNHILGLNPLHPAVGYSITPFSLLPLFVFHHISRRGFGNTAIMTVDLFAVPGMGIADLKVEKMC